MISGQMIIVQVSAWSIFDLSSDTADVVMIVSIITTADYYNKLSLIARWSLITWQLERLIGHFRRDFKVLIKNLNWNNHHCYFN